MGYDDPDVVGMFLLPPHSGPAVRPATLGNTYAALTELQAFRQPDAVFSADYETATSSAKGEGLLESGAAFQRCFLFTLPDASTTQAEPSWIGEIS